MSIKEEPSDPAEQSQSAVQSIFFSTKRVDRFNIECKELGHLALAIISVSPFRFYNKSSIIQTGQQPEFEDFQITFNSIIGSPSIEQTLFRIAMSTGVINMIITEFDEMEYVVQRWTISAAKLCCVDFGALISGGPSDLKQIIATFNSQNIVLDF